MMQITLNRKENMESFLCNNTPSNQKCGDVDGGSGGEGSGGGGVGGGGVGVGVDGNGYSRINGIAKIEISE